MFKSINYGPISRENFLGSSIKFRINLIFSPKTNIVVLENHVNRSGFVDYNHIVNIEFANEICSLPIPDHFVKEVSVGISMFYLVIF